MTDHAVAALAERGVTSPSTELLRLEMLVQHLDEAACLASTLGQLDLERRIGLVLTQARDQRTAVEMYSRIAPGGT